MRIIAGEMKGRRLKSPGTSEIRPTSDKVKEAVFSMLMPYMEGDALFLDLFAGSGSMGLEALSRGAVKAYFSDSSRESLSLARENALICGVEDRSVFLSGDFKSNLKRIKEPVDIVFIDPPYGEGLIKAALKALSAAECCKIGCVAVCEHRQREIMPEETDGFALIKSRRYGATGISIYERV